MTLSAAKDSLTAGDDASRQRVGSFKQAITESMTILGRIPKVLFVGQSVKYDGQAQFDTFSGVPVEKRIEMPVAEDFQLGFCTGLSLQGYLPICFYPRMDFLILAANQLVNHLDKIPLMSGYKPKVIIRTVVGQIKPLNAGLQHTQDHTEALRLMLKTVKVDQICHADEVYSAYHRALEYEYSTIIVENPKELC
jgi:pyruvate/2-oxoglutarate/acetoin dehydrogenase E1 component